MIQMGRVMDLAFLESAIFWAGKIESGGYF